MADDTSVNEIVVHPTNGSLIVAATDQGMYASTDHGGSWTQTHASAAWDAEVDVTNPGVVYAGTDTGVLLSKDFGQTWQDITTDQLTSELWPLDDMGSLTFDYNPFYGAKAVGVSCDGAIVYAAISGLGVMVSVAPGYAEIPEDPDQVSVMSQRTQANMDADRGGQSLRTSTSLRPRRYPNFTTPSAVAKRVSSPPRPTLVPGWNLVPRWRTMMLPAVTRPPSKTFTPRRCALESLPLRVEPPPLVLDMSSAPLDSGYLDLGQVLAVTPPAALVALVLVVGCADLGALGIGQDAGRHR